MKDYPSTGTEGDTPDEHPTVDQLPRLQLVPAPQPRTRRETLQELLKGLDALNAYLDRTLPPDEAN
jgi:hypothetical protein